MPDGAKVAIEVLEAEKRPVAAVADHDEVRDVRSVEIRMDHKISIPMLFDPGHSLDERILREQFGYLARGRALPPLPREREVRGAYPKRFLNADFLA